MRASIHLTQIAGINIYLHATFFLLPLWIGWKQFSERHLWQDAWIGVGLVLILFVIVVLHELAHALTARRFGIRTRDITLLPIGGVARMERMPEQPRQELLVALAGPAVNVTIALLLFGVLEAGSRLAFLPVAGGGVGDFLLTLMWVNVGLVIFNLIPAFPMDGGRVLRALLAMRLSYARATRIAAVVGRILAVVFGVIGICSLLGGLGPISNPFLLVIALFVWMGAAQEDGLVQMKALLARAPLRRLLITDFRTLSPHEPLAQVVEYLLTGWQKDFPVVENGLVTGLLTHQALVDGLARGGPGSLVREAMLREFATIDPAENIETALLRLRNAEGQLVLAVTDGHLRGILERNNVREYLLGKAVMERDSPSQTMNLTFVERQPT